MICWVVVRICFLLKLFHFFGCAVSSLSCTGFLYLWQVEATLFVVHSFTLWRLLLLQSMGPRLTGSVVVVHGLRCSVACAILPRPNVEPVPATLACKFLSTRPPGKSSKNKTLSSRMAAKNPFPFPVAIDKNSNSMSLSAFGGVSVLDFCQIVV